MAWVGNECSWQALLARVRRIDISADRTLHINHDLDWM